MDRSRYKSITIGVVIGGVFGLIAFFLAILGLVSAFFETLGPALLPTQDLINTYFAPEYQDDVSVDTGGLMTALILSQIAVFAALGGLIAAIHSWKTVQRAYRVLLICLVLVAYLSLTGAFPLLYYILSTPDSSELFEWGA